MRPQLLQQVQRVLSTNLPLVMSAISVVDVDEVVGDDAIGNLWREPFNQHRVGAGILNPHIDWGTSWN